MQRTPLTSLESLVRLGVSFVRTVVRNRVVRGTQLPRVLAQYRPDGLLSAEARDPGVLAAVGRCTACRRCDLRALELDGYTALGPQGPMGFVLGASRLAGGAEPGLPGVSRDLLTALTEACPVAVPFGDLVDLVLRRENELRTARMEARTAPAPAGLDPG